MNPFVPLVAAMAVSIAIIPFMGRVAPRIGMMDRPEARKVHTVPTARVGGWGIVLGALAPIILWVSFDPLIEAYVFGALVLLAFGTADDCNDIGHWGKFLGQFIAVIPVVLHADLYVTRLPFVDVAIPPSVGIPFTVFAMVGMINAINHSDGLDGLAGGESLLSLLAIATLAYAYDGDVTLTIAVASLGGILGFLRFNTHPARVFMGDSGSQFLGFSLAVLAILLTQRVNPALSPALPILLLGLPIIDILAVLTQRIYHGMNWFKATKNHIHHRLLDLGFEHYEVVIFIYSIQAFLVICAVVFSYESDYLVAAIYIGVCALLFGFLLVAEKSGWRVSRASTYGRLSAHFNAVREHTLFLRGSKLLITIMIPAFVMLGTFSVEQVPRDFGVMSAVLFVVFLAELIFGAPKRSVIVRGTIYATVMFVVYLMTQYSGSAVLAVGSVQVCYFVILAAAVWTAIRRSGDHQFDTTPTDYLIVFVVMAISLFSANIPAIELRELGLLVVRIMILLYGCEVIIIGMKSRYTILSLSCLVALAGLSIRGLLI